MPSSDESVRAGEIADKALCDFAKANPDEGLAIMTELARSDDFEDRFTAAVYVDTVIESYPEEVVDLWEVLLNDPDREIVTYALEAVEAAAAEVGEGVAPLDPAIQHRLVDLHRRYTDPDDR